MAKKKNGLRKQVQALEALAGFQSLSESDAIEVNGGSLAGASSAPRPIKRPRGTGAVAVRRGTGAIAVRIGGTGAVVFRGTGSVAVIGKGY